MQKKTAFEGSLPIVAAALGRYCGVNVEMCGGVPCTDGKTIRLPFISAKTPEEESKIIGLLCHESAHIRFTDMHSTDRGASGLAFAIDNALEDVRVERAMNVLYPGAERFFKAAHRDIVANIVSKPIRSDASIFPLYLLAVAERHLLKREWLQPLVDKTTKAVVKLVGKEVTATLARLALEVKDAKSIHGIRVIRRKVMQLLKATAQGNSGQSQEAKEGAKATSWSENGTSSEETEKTQRKERDRNNRTRSCNAKRSFKPQGNLIQGTSRLKELLCEGDVRVVQNPLSLSHAFENLRGSQAMTSTRVIPLSDAVRPAKGDAGIGRKRLEQAKADSSALRTSLTGLVQSKRLDHRWTATCGRRLDSRRLSRLVVGDRRLFQGRSEHKGPNTAVHVLLDLSGSMGYTGGNLAIRAALGLIHALQSISHVNPALTVFPGTACGRKDYACCTVVGHGKRLSSVDPREIGSLDAFGPTPIVGALAAVRMSLAMCKEKSKAVIVITDGSYFSDSLGQIVKEMEKQGIRLFGVQIQEEEGINRFITESERIEEIADLKGVLFKFAKRLLLS